jgi:hypothetical protein
MISWYDTLIDDRYYFLWKPNKGKAIKIKSMDDNYISNCIKVIDKTIRSYPGEAVYYGDSDYAEDAVEQENAHNQMMLDLLEAKKITLQQELMSRRKE